MWVVAGEAVVRASGGRCILDEGVLKGFSLCSSSSMVPTVERRRDLHGGWEEGGGWEVELEIAMRVEVRVRGSRGASGWGLEVGSGVGRGGEGVGWESKIELEATGMSEYWAGPASPVCERGNKEACASLSVVSKRVVMRSAVLSWREERKA